MTELPQKIVLSITSDSDDLAIAGVHNLKKKKLKMIHFYLLSVIVAGCIPDFLKAALPCPEPAKIS